MEQPTEGRLAWAEKAGWEETNWSSLANEQCDFFFTLKSI
jgi:hypothetical protein